jgi:hypothetical protein
LKLIKAEAKFERGCMKNPECPYLGQPALSATREIYD